jgi:hypothetical protein
MPVAGVARPQYQLMSPSPTGGQFQTTVARIHTIAGEKNWRTAGGIGLGRRGGRIRPNLAGSHTGCLISHGRVDSGGFKARLGRCSACSQAISTGSPLKFREL